MSEINVTPFVDVMLVLLVIFMITAPLMQYGLEVQLPKESTNPMPVKDIPTVTVKHNKRMFWYQAQNEQEIESLVDLARRVEGYHKNFKDGGVYLRADKALEYGFVMKIMATVKKAGVKNIGMVTDPENL